MEFDEYQKHALKTVVFLPSEEEYQISLQKITAEVIQSANTRVAVDILIKECVRLNNLLRLAYLALGLNGEAGEVAEKVKKYIRGDKNDFEEFKNNIEKETGDIHWYNSVLCSELGIKYNDSAQGNLDKLFDRQKRGVLKGEGDNR